MILIVMSICIINSILYNWVEKEKVATLSLVTALALLIIELVTGTIIGLLLQNKIIYNTVKTTVLYEDIFSYQGYASELGIKYRETIENEQTRLGDAMLKRYTYKLVRQEKHISPTGLWLNVIIIMPMSFKETTIIKSKEKKQTNIQRRPNAIRLQMF